MLSFIKAGASDSQLIAPLFDAYRVFYGQVSDPDAAATFIEGRLKKGQSVLFYASLNGQAVGFVHLYPTFSSVSMQHFYILNDLFVAPEFRGQKIGEGLLNKAKAFCETDGGKGLALETAVNNPAQKLYERLDWKKDTEFFHYFWSNSEANS